MVDLLPPEPRKHFDSSPENWNELQTGDRSTVLCWRHLSGDQITLRFDNEAVLRVHAQGAPKATTVALAIEEARNRVLRRA